MSWMRSCWPTIRRRFSTWRTGRWKWWAIIWLLALRLGPRARLGGSGLAAALLLTSFVSWTALSIAWATSTERAVLELDRALLYLGVCLPDLLFKSLLYLGGAPTWLCEPTHSPLGLVVFCYGAALLFEEPWRKRAFLALLGGSYLHLLFDFGKNYLGSGVILWAFPFSIHRVRWWVIS